MAVDNLRTGENSFEESGEKETSSREDYYKVVKPLRTYERDLAESIRGKQTSKVDIRLKEEKRAKERNEPAAQKDTSSSSKKFVLLLFVLILILASGSLFWFYLSIKPIEQGPETTTVSKTETLVKADSVIPINTLGKDWEDVVDEFKNHPSVLSLFPGKIAVFVPNIRAEEFLKEMNVEAPSSLLRALGEKINLGYYQSEEGLLPFMIIEVEDFENVFAGMFVWEKNVSLNLNFLFPYQQTERTFQDLSIDNKDLRILRNQNGQTIILYLFLDKKTILFTNSDPVFREIEERNN